MVKTNTQHAIEDLMNAFLGPDATIRQKYLFEQTLHSLVRLAKAEQCMEIKASVKKLTMPVPTVADSLSTKAVPRT